MKFFLPFYLLVAFFLHFFCLNLLFFHFKCIYSLSLSLSLFLSVFLSFIHIFIFFLFIFLLNSIFTSGIRQKMFSIYCVKNKAIRILSEKFVIQLIENVENNFFSFYFHFLPYCFDLIYIEQKIQARIR